jgi:hypothetical protein
LVSFSYTRVELLELLQIGETQMRKMLLTCTTAMFIGLGGCSTTQITDFLKLVQADAAQTCLFVPTIDTILAVAAALGIPAAGIAGAAIDAVAKAICSQVPQPSSAQFRALAPQGGGPARTVGTFGGVPINGWKTR